MPGATCMHMHVCMCRSRRRAVSRRLALLLGRPTARHCSGGSDGSGPLQGEQQLLATCRLIVPQRALAGSRRDRLQPARLAERIEHGLRELLRVELGEIHLSLESAKTQALACAVSGTTAAQGDLSDSGTRLECERSPAPGGSV